MKFKEVIDLTKNRIDEIDSSEQVLSIIKNAINTAYVTELSRYDKRVTKASIPVINGIATLPEDVDTVELITPSLIRGERIIGNSIVTARNIIFTVLYSALREELVNDNDEFDLSSKFKTLLSTYACYLYFEYRRKTNIAQMFLNEYQRGIALLIDNDSIGEENVIDVYTNGGDE